MTNKKGQTGIGSIWMIIPLVAALVVAGIFVAFGADVQTDISSDFADDSYAQNASTKFLEATDKVATKAPTLGTVGIVVIILLMLMGVVGAVMVYKSYM